MKANPYRIEGPALISFSGGRTSAYMLHQIIDAHDGQLPDDVHVTFANTGKEREETLRFVHECGSRWGVRVRWLEWRKRTGPENERFEEIGFNSAARDGEPFRALVAAKKYLPNSQMRFCTDELKIKVMKCFMRDQGFDHWLNVVGLRADEPGRVEKAIARSNKKKDPWKTVLPLAQAGVSQRDVLAFWDRQDFDLGLLGFEGNCDGCFLKGRGKLYEIARTNPGALEWWRDIEDFACQISSKASGAQFRPEFSYRELIRDVERQPDLFLGAFDDDPDADADCGVSCAPFD